MFVLSFLWFIAVRIILSWLLIRSIKVHTYFTCFTYLLVFALKMLVSCSSANVVNTFDVANLVKSRLSN